MFTVIFISNYVRVRGWTSDTASPTRRMTLVTETNTRMEDLKNQIWRIDLLLDSCPAQLEATYWPDRILSQYIYIFLKKKKETAKEDQPLSRTTNIIKHAAAVLVMIGLHHLQLLTL